MKRFLLIALACTFATARPALAVINVYKANITHDQEVGVPDEGTSGFGTFILNTDVSPPTLSYDVTLLGLDLDGLQTPGDANDNVTRTHFHAAAFGVNGGIVFGQIDPSASLRNDLDDLVVDPVAGTIKGVWDGTEGNGTTLTTQLPNLLNVDANNRTGIYFNVHTTDHAGGEVRGQLTLVPEPSTLVLCLLAGLAWCARRRD